MGLKSLNLQKVLFDQAFAFRSAVHTPRARRTWVLVLEAGGEDERVVERVVTKIMNWGWRPAAKLLRRVQEILRKQ